MPAPGNTESDADATDETVAKPLPTPGDDLGPLHPRHDAGRALPHRRPGSARAAWARSTAPMTRACLLPFPDAARSPRRRFRTAHRTRSCTRSEKELRHQPERDPPRERAHLGGVRRPGVVVGCPSCPAWPRASATRPECARPGRRRDRVRPSAGQARMPTARPTIAKATNTDRIVRLSVSGTLGLHMRSGTTPALGARNAKRGSTASEANVSPKARPRLPAPTRRGSASIRTRRRTPEFSGARSVSAATPCSAACQSTPPVVQLTQSVIPAPRKPFQLPSGSFLCTPSTMPRSCIGAPPGDVDKRDGERTPLDFPATIQKDHFLVFRDVAQHLELFVSRQAFVALSDSLLADFCRRDWAEAHGVIGPQFRQRNRI